MTRAPLRRAAVIAAVIAALPVEGARASGFDAPFLGTGQSGPTAADPAAVWWNPAELTRLQRVEVLGGGGLVVGDVRYRRERLGTYQTSDSLRYRLPLPPGSIDASKTGPSPEVAAHPVAPLGDLFAAFPVRDGLVLGVGAYVPYAATAHFPKNGAQAWQVRDAFLSAAHITASAAVRLGPQLSIGAGVSYVLGLAELSRLQDFAAVSELGRGLTKLGQANAFGPDAPTQVRELDTLARPFSLTRAWSHGVTFNAGISVRPTRALDLAFVYQHGATMRYAGRFALDMSDDLFTRDLAPAGLRYKPLVQGDAELAFALPRRLTFGAAYQASRVLRLDGFASYVFTSDVDAFELTVTSPDLAQPKLGLGPRATVRLPRSWRDTVWIEGSARAQVSRRLLVSFTAGYQSPASPDSTIDATSPDGHRIIGGAGAAYRLSERVTLLGDVRMQGIVPRTVVDSASDVGNGTYRLFVAAAAGHVDVRF